MSPRDGDIEGQVAVGAIDPPRKQYVRRGEESDHYSRHSRGRTRLGGKRKDLVKREREIKKDRDGRKTHRRVRRRGVQLELGRGGLLGVELIRAVVRRGVDRTDGR